MKPTTKIITLKPSAPVKNTEKTAMSTKRYSQSNAKNNNADKNKATVAIILLTIAVLGFLTIAADAQIVRNTDFNPDKTLKSNARVNPSTRAMEMSVPIAGFPGRGGASMSASFNYTSKVWTTTSAIRPTVSGTVTEVEPRFANRSAAGWTTTLASPYIDYPGDKYFGSVYGFDYEGETYGGTPPDQFENFSLYQIKRLRVVMPGGGSHEFRSTDTPVNSGSTLGGSSLDYTGTYLSVDGSKMRLEMDSSPTTLYMPDGSRYQFGGSNNGYATAYIDVHGNKMTYSDANKEWTDTMGRVLGNPLPANKNYTQAQSVGDQDVEFPGFDSSTNTAAVLSWRSLKHVSSSDPDDNGLGNLSLDLAYIANFYCAPSTYSAITGDHLFSGTSYQIRTCNYGSSAPGPVFNPVVLTKITLANGQSYQFKYNQWAEIEKIIYPSGAYERFEYGTVAPIQVTNKAPYDQANRGVTDRYVSEKGDGTDELHSEYQTSRSYATSLDPYRVTITNPDGTYTQQFLHDEPDENAPRPYGFDKATTGMPYETRAYSSSDVLLARTLTEYESTGPLSGGYSGATRDVRPTKEVSVQFESGNSNALATMTETVYDTTGNADAAYFSATNPKQTKKYNYVVVSASTATSANVATAAGWFSSGDLATVTEIDYLYDSNYKARNIVGLATETRVKDAAGNVKAKSQITYDETAYDLSSSGTMPTPASGSWVDPEDSGQFGSTIGNKRGRPTTVKNYYDIANSYYIETHGFYDQFGNARKSRDGRGNDTEMLYDDDYAFAYPTKSISPIPDSSGTYGLNDELETTATFDYNTGLPLTSVDANGQTSTMEYDDLLLRPTKAVAPNGHETITEYGAGTSPSTRWVKSRSQIDATNWKEAISWFDGLGRSVLGQSIDDELDDTFLVTCYDTAGRVSKSSNPVRANSAPTCASSLEWTTPAYDDLGRTISVTTPDSAAVETAYSLATSGSQIGTVVTAEDQAGKVRRSISNALGQLIRVDEPNSGLGAIDTPNQATTYAYDKLNNLTTVTQGSQSRTFAYDALSRMTQAVNPESGTVNYTYDANSNLYTKADARSITTTYVYDRLNRVTLRNYSDSTPDVTYYYDNLTNGKGKLKKVTSSVSTTEYTAIDISGRVTSHKQTTDGADYTTAYSYDLGGNLLEQTYPSGRIVKNTLDSDGALSQVQSKRSSETYRNFANSMIYNAAGAVTAMRLGNGKWENTVFNSRLQPTQIGLGNGVASQNLLKLEYEYGATASANNGNVTEQTITVPGVAHPYIQAYTYDELNRVATAEETKNSSQEWKQTFTYDRYGNRNFNTSGSNTTTLPPSFDADIYNPTIDPDNNKFDTGQGYSYDNGGNLISDAEGRTFQYDAVNKQVLVSDGSGTVGEYSFDGNGNRVKKYVPDTGETTIFIYDAVGKLIGEYSTLIETGGNAKTVFMTNDHLGSARISTDGPGNAISRHDYHPFGEEIDRVGYGGNILRKQFTDYESDSETGLDHSWAREYSRNHGRFQAPDPYWGSALSVNPQTWNRYTYSLNNSPNMIDKFGLKWLRKGNDYFWVDDKDFEKHGEQWRENGDFDEVIENGTIITVGPNQDNDRARGFAGQRVMLGGGNRVEEVTEDGAIIVRGSDEPMAPITMDNGIKIQEPVLMCSILVEQPQLRFFGAQHQWIKTNQKEAGAEKAPGDPRNTNINLFNLPHMTLVACVPGSSLLPGASCQFVRGVDVDIVNSELEIGKPLPGRWGPFNNCQTVVDGILTRSKRGPKPQPAPTP